MNVLTNLSNLLPNNNSENLTLLYHKFTNINTLDDTDNDSEIQNLITSLTDDELNIIKDIIVFRLK